MNNKKVAFITLGCKVNLYDTEAMSELFQKKGYEITDFDNFADIYIINTCTVTNFGDKKSRQMIRRAKRINPNAVVVATGCYAQVFPKEVENIEGVNIVIGTKDRGKIVEIIEEYKSENVVLNNVESIMKEKAFENLKINNLKDRTRAYIKIQEGCNRFCSYCIIPYARGPARSRTPYETIEEVKAVAKRGYKEIVLTGIHVASYGIDLKDKNTSLIKIIKDIHEIESIERIRLSSLEPCIINADFLNMAKSMPKLCDHFHLSLQSGCDRTLSRMNRKYTSKEYENAVNMIRKFYNDAAVTTDVIVGFPGETESDFNESVEFVKSIKLAKIHVFPYSPKRGTPAAVYENQISNDIKKQRTHKMLEISEELNKEFLNRQKGNIKSVLFERCISKDIYEGHTKNYIMVRSEIKENAVNNTLNVKIGDIIAEETVSGIVL